MTTVGALQIQDNLNESIGTGNGIVGMTGAFNLKDEHLLGHLEFHQVPDMRVQKDEVAVLWDNSGLDPKYLPSKIHPADAFRRATSTAASGNIIITDANGVNHKARLLVREVINDDNFIVRHLIRELVDDKNEVLDYAHVGSWKFNKKTKTTEDAITTNYYNEYSYSVIVPDTTKLVDELLNYHTKDTVRNLITKVTRDSNPTPIMHRSQGKFIPKGHYDTLKGLQSFLKELRDVYIPGSDCSMDLIPIVDTLEQREMIARKASFSLKEDADKLIMEFAEIMNVKKEIKPEIAERLIRNALEMRERMAEYEGLLNMRLQVLADQMNNFISNVRLAPTPESKKIQD